MTDVDPLIGRVLGGRFRILELVAKGGMGRIYRAEQAPLGREVALKILHVDGGLPDSSFQERFFREASVCARLSHPNTVRIFDYGTDAGVYFIAMEFLVGRTLNDAIRNEGPLPPERAITIARQIGKSLAQAHGQGVIHRDLKPANVFLARHGAEEFVKVLDFGLVKAMDSDSQVTRAGNVLGSPAYMAPEQIQGIQVTPASDVYALGVVMYAMLTRALPFKRENPLAVLNAHLHAPPPAFHRVAPDVVVPSCLEWIVMRCLEKDPTLRFSTMGDVDTALRVALHEIRGTLPGPVQWQLVEGRLDVPFSLEDSTSLTAPTPLTPVPEVRPVEDAPSSPTLNIETSAVGRPVQDFLIALAVVVALGIGALTALGAGVWFALDDEPQPAASVPAAIPEPAEAVVRPPVERAADAPEPERDTTRASDAPSVRTVRPAETRAEPPKREPPLVEPEGRGADATPAEEPVEVEPPPVEETPVEDVEPAGQDQEPEEPPAETDDWGSVGPSSDLKDPWSK